MATINSTVGSFTLISLNGEIQPVHEMTEVITRPGVDGVSVRRMGKQGRPFQMVGLIDVDNAIIAMQDKIEELMGAVGHVCTIVDNFGAPIPQVIMLDMRVLQTDKIITAVGGVSTDQQYLIRALFTFIETLVITTP